MVRILFILLTLAGLITAFQNCGTGGSLTLEKSSLGKSGFSKLLGSCSSLPAGKMCNERWSASMADQPAWQAACAPGGSYQSFECPSTPDKLGVCESLVYNQLQRQYYYQGYPGGTVPMAQEAALAQQNCAGTWQ